MKLFLREMDFGETNYFSKTRVIRKQKFKCFIGEQKETEIAHFVGQNSLYNLIYETKFQR